MAKKQPRQRRQPRDTTEEVIETQEGTAGEARRVDVSAVRARAEAPSLLPQEELDARQARIGERRRWGGPTLSPGHVGLEATTSSAPDVPPTVAAEPPSDH